MHLFGSRAMDAGSAVIATVAAWCAGSGPAAGGMDANRENMERYSFGSEKGGQLLHLTCPTLFSLLSSP